MSGRMFEVDYSPSEGFTLRVRPRAVRLLPDSTVAHLRAANKEFLMAMRSVLDEVIEGVEQRQARAEQAASGRRPRRVQVQGEEGKKEPA